MKAHRYHRTAFNGYSPDCHIDLCIFHCDSFSLMCSCS